MPVLLLAEADLPGEAFAEIAGKIEETGQGRTGQATAALKQACLSGARAGGDPLPLIRPSQAGNSWRQMHLKGR
jgi:hypothetical protein